MCRSQEQNKEEGKITFVIREHNPDFKKVNMQQIRKFKNTFFFFLLIARIKIMYN